MDRPPEAGRAEARLLPSTYARLWENKWTAAENRLADPEHLKACVTLDGPQEPSRGNRYVLSLDLGLKRDRTVATICHLEDGRQVVLDRIAVWAGDHANPVVLQEVEDWVVKAAINYRARIVCDPWQSVGLQQRLASHRLAVQEFVFSPSSIGKLATTLFNLIHDGDLALPPMMS